MENVKLEIIANGMNGEGIARNDGKVVFVDGAVEGDIVYVDILKENKNFSYAQINSFELASAYRRKAKCKYYNSCGGCKLQHIEYIKQLYIKTQNVQNLFNKQKLNVVVNSCISSDVEFGYRNKLTMYLTKNNCLGFFKEGSNNLIDINNCCLVEKTFNSIINKLNLFFKENREYNYTVIKGVSIRKVNNIFMFNFILSKKISFDKLENYLKLNKINYSLYYCINTENILPKSPCIFVGGEKTIFLTENGIRYPVFPLAFMQINNFIKDQIYKNILSIIKSNKVVLDAYSGMGLLSSMFAKKCKKVFAVEIDESASNSCREIARINGYKNLISICGDCEKEVPKILKDNKIDFAVLDPARKGVDNNTLTAVINAKPQNIIYLSCNPATLTRDIKTICDNGYQIEFVQPYDMFPNTSEVEVLVNLTLNKNV